MAATPYTEAELDDAIERISGDVARRFAQPEFHGPAMQALVDELRRMENARRRGDYAAAIDIVTAAQPAFDSYRPSNATSRSKAMIGEVMLEIIAHVSSESA